MSTREPGPYVVDPADPRAPTEEQWAALSEAERDRVCAMLPAEAPYELCPPEGDAHRKAREGAASTLDAFFRRIGRKVYISSELVVFYPGERRFVPDVLAVCDVEPHERTRWIVAREGKGLDLVLEVHFAGDEAKDLRGNVERYARLGIREYFVFDRSRLVIRGHRLPSARARIYEKIVPQAGRYASTVLGLDLRLDGQKLRFEIAGADVPESEELAAKLRSMVDDLEARHDEAARVAAAEAERAAAEAERAAAEAERAAAEAARASAEAGRADREAARARELERELAEARAEIARLRRGG